MRRRGVGRQSCVFMPLPLPADSSSLCFSSGEAASSVEIENGSTWDLDSHSKVIDHLSCERIARGRWPFFTKRRTLRTRPGRRRSERGER